MRKSVCLAIIMILTVSTLFGCKSKKDDMMNAYTTLLSDLYANDSQKSTITFFLKDLDNNGIEELIYHDTEKMTVYTFNDKVVEIGSYKFTNATTRLLYSENPSYSGIIYFYTGGGLESYNYITIKNNELVFEKLWDEDFADSYQDRERIIKYSDDNKLIEESEKAYQSGHDIDHLPLQSVIHKKNAIIISNDSCIPQSNSSITFSDKDAMSSHKDMAIYLKQISHTEPEFFFNDMDGNGISEMIVKQVANITVFTYNGTTTPIGDYNFLTNTIKLFHSESPSYSNKLFYSFEGLNEEIHGYLGIEDGCLIMKELWVQNQSNQSITELSNDKDLIKESKKVYKENNVVEFSTL